MIDDGSTDSTKYLINTKYPAARYYHLKNKGAAAARNYGIKMAKGNLIAFLDANGALDAAKAGKAGAFLTAMIKQA